MLLLPVAMIPNCAATRHAHFTLTGDEPALQLHLILISGLTSVGSR